MNKRSKLFSVFLSILVILLIVTPVHAQDEVEPTEEPELVGTSSKFLDHPIVKLLAQFFVSFFNPPDEDALTTDEGVFPDDNGIEGGGSPLESETGTEGEPVVNDEALESALVVPEEKIASMHEEDKLGFGIITKLTDIARMAQSTCSDKGEFCEVTLDSIIEEYKGGMSIGELFKKYGKPEHVGVGQIKKELDPKEKTNNGKPKDK